MTEAEWLDGCDPGPMAEALGIMGRKRKRRLFAVACLRQLGDLLKLEVSRRALDLAEQMSDGVPDPQTANAVRKQHSAFYASVRDNAQCDQAVADEYFACFINDMALEDCWLTISELPAVARQVRVALHNGLGQPDLATQRIQCNLLRDIFGNPFATQPPPADWGSNWRTAAATELARSIYEDRAFGLLPILADALEEAGCADAHVLNHCRTGGEHVRGCWVVDLVLGKE